MKLYTKIIDHRITVDATADAMAKSIKSVVTVIKYGPYMKVVYVFGRRLS